MLKQRHVNTPHKKDERRFFTVMRLKHASQLCIGSHLGPERINSLHTEKWKKAVVPWVNGALYPIYRL